MSGRDKDESGSSSEEESDDAEEEEPDLALLTKFYQDDDTFGVMAWRNEDGSLRTAQQKHDQVRRVGNGRGGRGFTERSTRRGFPGVGS